MNIRIPSTEEIPPSPDSMSFSLGRRIVEAALDSPGLTPLGVSPVNGVPMLPSAAQGPPLVRSSLQQGGTFPMPDSWGWENPTLGGGAAFSGGIPMASAPMQASGMMGMGSGVPMGAPVGFGGGPNGFMMPNQWLAVQQAMTMPNIPGGVPPGVGGIPAQPYAPAHLASMHGTGDRKSVV